MKRILGLTSSAVLAATMLVTGGGTASADPYDCSTSYPSRSKAAGVCTGGTGEYRVYTRCDASLAFDYTKYGAWVRIGQTSTATCSEYWGDRAFNAGIQVR